MNKIYIDGACKGNPGKAGWGIVQIKKGEAPRKYAGHIYHGTNNIAELYAAIMAVNMVKKGESEPSLIISDSIYVVNNANEQVQKWAVNGWRKVRGEPIKNKAMWEKLYADMQDKRIKFKWVRGHSGDKYNELADELASMGANNIPPTDTTFYCENMFMNIDNTLNERGSRYGTFEDNAKITQMLMEVIKTAPSYDRLTHKHKEAFHMIFHKIARCVCGDPMYIDNIHDIVGYAKLLEDYLIAREGNEL